MSTPTKAAPRKRTPRTPAAKGRRVRADAVNPYAVMAYRLCMAVLMTIVALHFGGN